MTLPIKLNYPPMEAEPATDLPQGSQWHYDPKWEEGANIALQSKSQKSLSRYFPELVKALANLKAKSFVLDGEIVIPVERNLSFDDLLMRIHPAASRIQKLSESTPSKFIVFDLLVDDKGKRLVGLPLQERRKKLEVFFRSFANDKGLLELSPVTNDVNKARKWFHMGVGLDGIVAKRKDLPYQSGACGYAENKNAAHRRLRCGRLSLPGKEASGGVITSRSLQR